MSGQGKKTSSTLHGAVTSGSLFSLVMFFSESCGGLLIIG